MIDIIGCVRGGILTAWSIDQAIKKGKIGIEPFDSSNIGINSYDLHIGNKMKTIAPNVFQMVQCTPEPNEFGAIPSVLMTKEVGHIELDLKKKIEYNETEIPDEGIMLVPNELYLIPTIEKISTNYYEPIITGRSSSGRAGISVHCEAGFGDIGFSGNWTLQVKTTYPVRIYPGMSLAQVYFLSPCGKITKLYKGKYQNSVGAAESRIFQDFKK